MSCTINYNADNTINKVFAPNGQESQLFEDLNRSVLVGNKTTAWDIQKNAYSSKVVDMFKDNKNKDLQYFTGEPKLFFKKGSEVSSSLEEVILSDTGSPVIEIGFMNPKSESFMKIAETSNIENQNNVQSFVVDQVRKGFLDAEKVNVDGQYFYQGKGTLDSTRRYNAQLVVDASVLLTEGKVPKITIDRKSVV